MAGAGSEQDRPENGGAGKASRAIAKGDFEQVIRRAAELSLSEADPDEQLTEEEVLRIATELGLPPQHVQRALAELPELSVRERWYDSRFGSPIVTTSRIVPGQTAATLRRIEDYLVTREYLQLVRRRGSTLALVPADDTISSVARAFTRSSAKHHLARASRVVVGVDPMPGETAHVRFEVDLSEARSDAVKNGIALGAVGGVLTGSLAAGLVAGLGTAIPEALGALPHILAFAGAFGGTVAAGYSSAARRFRDRVTAARLEVNALLDRLEHGERLEPPAAPWRRKLFG